VSTPPPDVDEGFDALDLPEPLREAIRSRGLASPTLVQARVADAEHADQDLLVSAQTGSGKTLAFGFLIARDILPLPERSKHAAQPLALVLAPTRELAVQVQKELEWLFAKARGVRVHSATGGTNAREEMVRLKGGCEILVATPGRLCDHLKRKSVSLASAKVVVLDEGDEMLRFGFREDLETILSGAPKSRRTHLFSATLPPPILKLASTYQISPARITASTAGAAASHEDIEFVAHVYGPGEREAGVVNVLRRHDAEAAIVFTETRMGAAKLGADLARRGFSAVTLSGEMTQPERTRALASLREGRAKVLVATDVAARGLDLPDVGLVIHADLPNDASGITHRSGRTGRAGKKGVSVLLASRNERNSAERMLRGAGVKVKWSPLPTKDEIAAADSERLLEELSEEATLATSAAPDAVFAEVDRLIEKIPVRELIAVLLGKVVGLRPAAVPLRAGAPEEAPRRGDRDRDRDGDRFERPERGRRFDRPERSERPERGPPPDRGERPTFEQRRATPTVMFRVNVGEAQNAEPRWLVPLICRRGAVEGRDIGKIRIGARSTLFEISASLADAFEQKVLEPDPKDARVLFERATGDEREVREPSARPERPSPPRERDASEAPRERPNKYPPRDRDAGPPSDRPKYTPRDRDAGPPSDRPKYTPRDRDAGPPSDRPKYTPRDREAASDKPAMRDRGPGKRPYPSKDRERPAPERAAPDRSAPAFERPAPRETTPERKPERRPAAGVPRERPANRPAHKEETEDLGAWKGPRGKPRPTTPAGYDD